MTTEDAAFWAQVGQLRDAAAMLERRDARLVAELKLLREQLGYALDALDGHPATGWTINDARQALDEGLAVMSSYELEARYHDLARAEKQAGR